MTDGLRTFAVVDKRTGTTVWSGKAVDKEHALRSAEKKCKTAITHATHTVRNMEK